ncbi:MAG: DUF211 domain-containing protein [Proteobacteria bacterium]|nr:DUF211 domain-containing protein [Pseudomonadota bacterium]
MKPALNIRRLALDVDKASSRPTLIELAAAITACSGVEAFNITVNEIDMETVGMDITIEGQFLDYEELVKAMEGTGSAVHSIDQVVCGERIIEHVRRTR